VVVNAEPTKANKTTPGSERQSLLKNDLTGPTLLEMSDKRLPDKLMHYWTSSALRRFAMCDSC
jgi:hypothetical protein